MQELEQLITHSVRNLGGEATVLLSHPESLDHGDYTTNVALQVAKQLGKKPQEIAKHIAEELNKHASIHKAVVAGPGFVNIFLKQEFFADSLRQILEQKENFGRFTSKKLETWLIEHTAANPNKALHLGHLRNNVTAMAVSNMWEALGIRVVRDYVQNDRGIAIAKLMWGYLKFARKDQDTSKTDLQYWSTHKSEWQTPEDAHERPDRFVDRLYFAASQDFEKEEIEAHVRKLVLDWEAGEQSNRELWRMIIDWALAGQQMTMARLGSKTDMFWFESEHYEKGKQYVQLGLERGIFKKLEDGAVLSSLESYTIPDTIIQKRDGTSMYITQDIALTELKKKKFKAHKMFWTVGPEQSLALKQLFAICEQLGIGRREEFTHLAYGYMSIKGAGKMSSRAGNVVYVDELIDQTKAELEKRIPAEKFNFENKDEALEQIALGAIKYSILKTNRLTDTSFDFETSLSFEGDSGPYLQYTYARAKSVIAKASALGIVAEVRLPHSDNGGQTAELTRLLYRLPEVVERAGLEYAPNYLASFLLLIAQEFNSFYGNERIADLEDATAPYKVALTAATAQVLHNGLTHLGIKTLEKM